MTRNDDLQTWSFLGLLVGGILILAGGLMAALRMGAYGWAGMPMGMMGSWMDPAALEPWAWWMGGVGILSGSVVLLAAYFTSHGTARLAWSGVGIAAGAVSLLAMGGFVLGAIAAIAGGALGILGEQRAARGAA